MRPLEGKVALVAGATRGAGRGIAAELGAAGATVYVTGRSTAGQPSEYARPETIEETAAIMRQLGGKAIAVRVDHLVPAEVERLVAQIRAEQGRLDILVNDIWGGEKLFEWNKPVWEHDLANGLRLLRLAIDTHLITAHHALPLMITHPGVLLVEVTDGTAAYNATHYRLSVFYDLAKAAAIRMAWAHAKEANWREACKVSPHFAISETPRFTGRAVATLAADPDRARWTGKSVSSGDLAKVYGFADLDGSRPDCWRHLVEVQEAGRPADTTGYR